MELQGRNAVVVGGATGIGAGVCRALVARGAKVHICDRDADGAAALVASLPEGAVKAYHCDVTDPATLAAAEKAIRADGDIAVVFVNAGVVALKPLLKSTREDWNWLLGVNLFGTINTFQAFLPGLLAQGARSRIVVTSSITAVQMPRERGMSLYVASKTAQLGLCNSMRTELAGTTVDVSVVMPGGVRTSIVTKSQSEREGMFEVERREDGEDRASRSIEPELAGERIVQGVEQDQTYITTHPNEREEVRELLDEILDAFRV